MNSNFFKGAFVLSSLAAGAIVTHFAVDNFVNQPLEKDIEAGNQRITELQAEWETAQGFLNDPHADMARLYHYVPSVTQRSQDFCAVNTENHDSEELDNITRVLQYFAREAGPNNSTEILEALRRLEDNNIFIVTNNDALNADIPDSAMGMGKMVTHLQYFRDERILAMNTGIAARMEPQLFLDFVNRIGRDDFNPAEPVVSWVSAFSFSQDERVGLTEITGKMGDVLPISQASEFMVTLTSETCPN